MGPRGDDDNTIIEAQAPLDAPSDARKTTPPPPEDSAETTAIVPGPESARLIAATLDEVAQTPGERAIVQPVEQLTSHAPRGSIRQYLAVTPPPPPPAPVPEQDTSIGRSAIADSIASALRTATPPSLEALDLPPLPPMPPSSRLPAAAPVGVPSHPHPLRQTAPMDMARYSPGSVAPHAITIAPPGVPRRSSGPPARQSFVPSAVEPERTTWRPSAEMMEELVDKTRNIHPFALLGFGVAVGAAVTAIVFLLRGPATMPQNATAPSPETNLDTLAPAGSVTAPAPSPR
jgi:hypothetical protein